MIIQYMHKLYNTSEDKTVHPMEKLEQVAGTWHAGEG